MKCLSKYFFQIAFCLSMLLTLNGHAAATRESAFLDVDGLLRNDHIRKIISDSVRGVYPPASTLRPFGDGPLDLAKLKTILPERLAVTYQSTIWPKIASNGFVLSEFIAGQTVVYISFPTSSEKGYRELDISKTWCPRDATHVSQPSSQFLAGFFEGAPAESPPYELNYSHTVLALYLQNAIWDIITPLTSVEETNYNFVVTGHGPGGVAAQIFSLLLAQRIHKMKINGIVNVISCGSPRAFTYHAAEYVRNRLGPNHIRVFASRKDGASDPFISYPATLFSGSTEAVGPFDWEVSDEAHVFAKANNVWTHPVNLTALPVELSPADVLRGIGLSSVGVYANALSKYVPSGVPVDAVKAGPLLSTTSAHGGVLAAVPAPPAASCGAGSGGASASAITEHKTTPSAPRKAAGGSGASAAPTEHILTPSAIAGAEDKGEGANTSEGGGWASSLLGVSNWWAPAPPPATVVLPPYPPPATAASGGAGHAGSAAAGAGSTEDGGAASPGMIAAATSFWDSYVPSAVKDRVATAAEAVASGVEVAAAVGGKLLEEVARETGKVVFSRSLADQTLRFENYGVIYQNALQYNKDAFKILNGLVDKDPIAKGYVAIALAFGFGTVVDLELAEKYAKEVEPTIASPAFMDILEAQILYGLMLETGLGTINKYPDITERRAKATALYERAKDKGSLEALVRLAELDRAEENVGEAIKKLEALASLNHPGAINSLGEIYYAVRNIEEAYPRFKLASRLGNAVAMYNLGRLYYEHPIGGMTLLERRKAAKENLEEAIDLGQISANALLGSILYEEGDYGRALSYFIRATAITFNTNIPDYFRMFKSMKIATAEAHFMLYLMYKAGHGTVSRESDREKALEHLRAAETLRHESACSLSAIDHDPTTLTRKTETFYNLAMKYYTGTTVPLDLAAAGIFFSEAASIVLPGAGSATITPAAKLSLAKAAFASVVVKLEMLGAPATVAPAPHTSAGAAGGAGASAAITASPKGASVTSGKIGAGAGSAPSAGLSPGTVITSMASFMATPPPGAGIGTKSTSLGGATSPSVAVPKDISGDIQKLLENAKAGGLAEADSLLARIRTESLDKVAKSIYAKRHPRPGETLRIDPFEAAAK